jgi:hypothetical protein
MPLRDMGCTPLLRKNHRLRDFGGFLRPLARAEAEGLREPSAVELAVGRPPRRGWILGSGNGDHPRLSSGQRRLRRDNGGGKTVPGGHAGAGEVVGGPHLLARGQARGDAQDGVGEIAR